MPEEAVPAFVVTCEHAGNRVPPGYAHLFEGAEALLASHRGWDPGAGALARSLARRLRAPLAITTVTRLLVEVNRTEGHPRVFSELARPLSGAEREAVLARWYRP